MLRLLPVLSVLASSVSLTAAAQELTPEAEASPVGALWMTIRVPDVRSWQVYQGSQPVPGLGFSEAFVDSEGEWVARFALVPEAHRTAQRARTVQLTGIALSWSAVATALSTAAAFLSVTRGPIFPSTPIAAGTFAIAGALALSLEIASVAMISWWHRLIEDSTRQFNTGINAMLPPDQRFELGELGVASR